MVQERRVAYLPQRSRSAQPGIHDCSLVAIAFSSPDLGPTFLQDDLPLTPVENFRIVARDDVVAVAIAWTRDGPPHVHAAIRDGERLAFRAFPDIPVPVEEQVGLWYAAPNDALVVGVNEVASPREISLWTCPVAPLRAGRPR